MNRILIAFLLGICLAFLPDEDDPYAEYAGSATLIVAVESNGIRMSGCCIYAVDAEGNVRGCKAIPGKDTDKSSADTPSNINRQSLAYLVIHGNAPENVWFKVVFGEGSDAKTFESLTTFRYSDGLSVGTSDKPFIINIPWDDSFGDAVLIGTTGYATYSSPHSIVVPDASSGTEFFGARINDEGTSAILIPTSKGQIVGNGEGVIIRGTPNTTVYVEQTGESGGCIQDNELVGTASETKTFRQSEAFLLGERNGIAIFGLCKAGTLAPRKAYLPANVSGTKEFLSIDEGTSVIEKIHNGQLMNGDSRLYNLSGMSVDSNYKGIVIINGKKLFIH